MNNIKVILWDFDGVIMNSNEVRDYGFQEVLKDYPEEQVEKLMKFHQENGGLSRYVKFNYFFNDIRGEEVDQAEINKWAGKFSEIMLKNLKNEALLIQETIQFIEKNHKKYTMHIVSGSDQKELREICADIGIAKYFNSIHGSPTHKSILVEELLEKHQYDHEACILIGDSINDYDAAIENNIYFLAYNNASLDKKTNYAFKMTSQTDKL